MLQSIREGVRSPWVLVVIGLIVLSFVLTGAESLTFGASPSGAATVNSEEISEAQLQFAIEQQRRQLAEVYGDQLDPSLLDDEFLRPSALNNLIDRALLNDLSTLLGIEASQSAVRRSIMNNAAFALDGDFSPDYYRDVLRSNGLTPEQYLVEQSNIDQLIKLESIIASADFTTQAEAKAAIDVIVERRDIRFLVVPNDYLGLDAVVSDSEVADYYAANREAFMQPEMLKVAFIELTMEQFIEPVDEDELAVQLSNALADFETKAQSEVAHILLTRAEDETGAGYAARVDDVAARIASGENFAEIASSASDDIGSSSIGGDLGFTDGSVFPEEMEEAIATLSIGGVSDPVVTDAGTHFILVKSRSAAEQGSEDALRREITESLQTAQAQRDLLIAVDRLRDAVFTTQGLTEAAQELGVTVSLSQPFSRNSGTELFAEETLREAAFSDDVLLEGNNSDVIELSGSRFVALSLVEQMPAGVRPLADVEDIILSRLEAQARELAMANLVSEVNETLAQGGRLEDVSADKGLEWRVELAATRQNANLPAPVLRDAFGKPSNDTLTVSAIRLDEESYALVQLVRTQAGQEDSMVAFERDALLREISDVQGSLLRQEFVADLKRRGDVVIR